MARPFNGQFSAKIEGDFVVFIIGMRINKPWKINKWLPLFTAIPKLMKELKQGAPDNGFLGHTPLRMNVMVQYWRSFEHLEAYARSREALHWPAWVAFNKRVKGARGDVGLWHETFRIRAGEYECVYTGMPPFGLSASGTIVPIGKSREGQTAARDRLAGKLD